MPAPGFRSPRRTSASPHDTRNVEERLVFTAPAAGRWIVRVRGVDVPMGPQPFALVVRGALTDCAAPAAPAAPTLSTPADNQVQVSWPRRRRRRVLQRVSQLRRLPRHGVWFPWRTVTTPSFLDTTVSGGRDVQLLRRLDVGRGGGVRVAALAVRVGDPDRRVHPRCPSFHGLGSAASAGQARVRRQPRLGRRQPYCARRRPLQRLPRHHERVRARARQPDRALRRRHDVLGRRGIDLRRDAAGTSCAPRTRRPATAARAAAATRSRTRSRSPRSPTVCPRSARGATMPATPARPRWSRRRPGAPPRPAGARGPRFTRRRAATALCVDLSTPPLTLADPGQGPQLTFWTKHDLDYDPTGEIFGTEGSLGQAEIATGSNVLDRGPASRSPELPGVGRVPVQRLRVDAERPTNYFTGTNLTYTTYTASLGELGRRRRQDPFPPLRRFDLHGRELVDR